MFGDAILTALRLVGLPGAVAGTVELLVAPLAAEALRVVPQLLELNRERVVVGRRIGVRGGNALSLPDDVAIQLEHDDGRVHPP